MALPDFRNALRLLGDDRTLEARVRADAVRQQRTPEDWIGQIALHWPAERARLRSLPARILPGVLIAALVGYLMSTGRPPDPSRTVLYVAFFMASSGIGALKDCLTQRKRQRTGLCALLDRLDDSTLVPLWLEVLPRSASPRRGVYLARLARHLPQWHESGEPLPEPARRALLKEIRRLAKADWTDDELAFLTASLVSLDTDPERGIPADPGTRVALAALRERWGSDRLQAATEEALRRTAPL